MISKLAGDILSCRECAIRENQDPVLDEEPLTDKTVVFVELSALKVRDLKSPLARPLSPFTPAGKIIGQAEDELRPYGYSFYHTNLVKCVPLTHSNKLRNPNSYEIEMCLDNLLLEIDYYEPVATVLLGQGVYMPVLRLLEVPFKQWRGFYFDIYDIDGLNYIPAWHPDYISARQNKNIPLYVEGLINAVKRCDPLGFQRNGQRRQEKGRSL